MRIRRVNIRSLKAAQKLPYIVDASQSRQSLYKQLNRTEDIFQLFEIPKDQYTMHMLRNHSDDTSQKLEA